MNREMVKIEDKTLEHAPMHRLNKAQKAFKSIRRGSDGGISKSPTDISGAGSPQKIKKRSDSTESWTRGGECMYQKG